MNVSKQKILTIILTLILASTLTYDRLKINIASASTNSFSIMQISDTQFLSSQYPNLYSSLTTWIANNVGTYNVKMVIHTGDLVDQYYDSTQWQNANNAMSLLTSANVPYTWDAGNHDQNGMDNPNSGWVGNQYSAFNPSTFSSQSYWVGSSIQGKNTAAKFSFNGYNFLVINLESEANDTALTWATNLLNTYSGLNYNIIVATHAYLASPDLDFSTNDLPYSPTWEQNLQTLLNNYPNVFLTLNGHTSPKIDPINVHNQVNGRTQIEFDDQYNDNDQGACSTRIYTFDLNSQTVTTSTYSVWNSTWLTDSEDVFSFPVQLDSSPAPTSNQVTVSSATASSYDSTHTPNLAIDGDDTTWNYWGTNAMITSGKLPQWLQLDLGTQTTISQITTHFYDGDTRTYTYYIQASTDGSNWNTIVPTKTGHSTVTDTFNQVTAKYIKITVTGNTANLAAHIVEIRIYQSTTQTPTPTPTQTQKITIRPQ